MSTSSTTETGWESRWISVEGTFDPAYERTNAALRRWVDGMEQALLTATAASTRAGLSSGRSRGLTLSHTPHRR
jgi:hypothetical protein